VRVTAIEAVQQTDPTSSGVRLAVPGMAKGCWCASACVADSVTYDQVQVLARTKCIHVVHRSQG
jgi:hypothetical protein